MRRHFPAVIAALAVVASAAMPASVGAQSADKLKIGFISTLSGPSAALGVDIRDGFQLALELSGGKLGNVPTELLVGDDQFKPEVGRQLAEKYVKLDKVNLLTGMVFSNIMLASVPVAFENKTIYLSPNAAPSSLAGKECNPNFFALSWPNDAYHEAAGKHASDRGYKSVYLIAPNYQAGKDSLAGFKRFYKGAIAEELYTKLGQLDYAAELAQVRAKKPDALYIFLPGGMGINFIKQFVGAGLSKEVQLLTPGFGSDQDVIRPVGDAMLGLMDTAHWALDLDNPVNKRFVAEFEKKYKRLPSVFASQGYDTALAIDAAVREVKGKVDDGDALRRALKAAKFQSTRGAFKFNRNHYPIQNYYLRVIGRDSQGRIVNKTIGTVLKDHGDAYVQDCPMK
jgi:branched-chain amino acid transport system substrate-binding protein